MSMLVRVGIDLHVLEDAATGSPNVMSVSAHRELIRLLVRHGAVLLASKAEKRRLLDLMEATPPTHLQGVGDAGRRAKGRAAAVRSGGGMHNLGDRNA